MQQLLITQTSFHSTPPFYTVRLFPPEHLARNWTTNNIRLGHSQSSPLTALEYYHNPYSYQPLHPFPCPLPPQQPSLRPTFFPRYLSIPLSQTYKYEMGLGILSILVIGYEKGGMGFCQG